jgi:asparagine synthase (glutamine-hydrolysing)
MFAIALYDIKKDMLLLARDRFGEKPLKYYIDDNKFVFASELKSILLLDQIDRTIDHDALSAYLSQLYIPAPLTIFKKIRKLLPGTYIILKNDRIRTEGYFDLQYNSFDISTKTENEYLDDIDQKLKESVRLRMISDVPIGVFLSGGVDSSLITAYMSELSDQPIKTFSVGFGNTINELPYAQKVADMYGTDHNILQVNEKIEDIIRDIVWYYEEPFADSANIPTYMISKEARKKVKVVLTGEGGDELFGGYPHYRDFLKTELFFRYENLFMKYLFYSIFFAEKITKRKIPLFHNYLMKSIKKSTYELCFAARQYFTEEEKRHLLKLYPSKKTFSIINSLLKEGIDNDHKPFFFDLIYRLPNDLLVKVDIASMANSLECRAPFLDINVVESAFNMPYNLKINGSEGKYLLKKLAERKLPRDIIYRKKQGFGAPVEEWLYSNLKNMVISDLKNKNHKVFDLLNWEYVQKLLQKFYQEGDSSVGYKIWIIFILALWCEKYL